MLLCRVVALFTPRIILQLRKERTDNGSKPENTNILDLIIIKKCWDEDDF